MKPARLTPKQAVVVEDYRRRVRELDLEIEVLRKQVDAEREKQADPPEDTE